jgi:crossover junction endodeoxyribonuclease RusA
MVHSSRHLTEWRRRIIVEAINQRNRNKWPLIDCAAGLAVDFRFPKPARTAHDELFRIQRPDVDKLARAVLDAFTEAAIWVDDSLCVELTARKLHATDDAPTGAHIAIWLPV